MKAINARLLGLMTGADNFLAALAHYSQDVLDLAHAEGAAILHRDEVVLLGKTPSREQVLALAEWMAQEGGQELYSTDRLSQVFPAAAPYKSTASGMLAVAISKLHHSYVMWFRPEVIQTIRWGGDPQKQVPDRFVVVDDGIVATLPSSRPPLPPGKLVLLVEDLTANILVARAIIEGMGVGCDVAHDGREALQKMKAGRYHLVLMDVNMPVMDGIAATEHWRRMESEQAHPGTLPIIGMTAHALLGDRERCLEAGMNDYLSKPITAGALQEKLEKSCSIPKTICIRKAPAKAERLVE